MNHHSLALYVIVKVQHLASNGLSLISGGSLAFHKKFSKIKVVNGINMLRIGEEARFCAFVPGTGFEPARPRGH